MQTKSFRGMSFRRMGYSGLWVSEVGLGLWKWGDPSYDGSRVGEHEGFRILDRALELGVLHWDTACSYNAGSGNSERLLGRYFAARGPRVRDQAVLATKIRNPVRAEHELAREFSPNESGSSRKYILQAVQDSLRRLQTDRIDVLYHHGPNLLPDGSWETPLEETWDALDQLVRAGQVLYLAVSNRSVAQLEEEQGALSWVSDRPSRRIVAVQNHYNLLERAAVAGLGPRGTLDDERAFLDALAVSGVGLVPYLPLAAGLLTGRYRPNALDASGRLSQEERLGGQLLTPANLERVERLLGMAQRKGCSLAQLAIAWLLAHEEVCSVIAGVTRLAQLEENVGATQVALSEADIAEIEALAG